MQQLCSMYTFFFVGSGEKGDLALCFQHCGLMRDGKTGFEPELMWYQPEPYFMHPIAKAVAEQMKNKDKLSIIPPSHHHTHDYVLHSNGVMCVVVGEAQSGTNYRAELDKCLPGICKSLNIMHYGVAITSSQMKSSVHLGHIGGILIHGMKPVQSLMIDSIMINKQGEEDKYGAYIDKLLDVLERFVGLHMASDIFMKVPPVHYLHPGFNVSEVSTCSYNITIPGLYMGLNGAFVKEKFPEFYPIWVEGHRNRIAKIAYPTAILCTSDGQVLINFMPMQCEKYKEGTTAVDSDDEGVTNEDIAGK